MRVVRITVVLLCAVVFAGCASESPTETGSDPHSFARPDEVVVDHIDLELKVDFDRRAIDGTASLHVRNLAGASRLHLDTRDLEIRSVSLDRERNATGFVLGEEVPYLGRSLTVEIGPETEVVHVEYTSDPGAIALQWVEPYQTAGGKHPFLLTQSQSIFARTWVPCQDTPSVRFTYDATVRVSPGLLALMSAENPVAKSDDGVYRFRMPQRIPSYLLALAVGDLEFRSLGPRSGVYADPAIVERAAWEFADTERMIDAATELYGPYRWGRYDTVVLPPSFPMGGMENPRLTFATPTVLAGDRSLVALAAHELAHSWSGNLVTNATWDDFWLNEGFTVYLEIRIMEAVFGPEQADIEAVLSFRSLHREIEELGPDHPDSRLKVDLRGRDAEDSFTGIAYDKGYLFLRTIEEAVGREAWDAFLREYFDTFQFQSMTSERFVEFLRERLLASRLGLEQRLRVEDWIYGPGVPDNHPAIESAALAQVEGQLAAWNEGTPAAELDVAGWSALQWLHFLRSLPIEIEPERMADLDAAFAFTAAGNSEILSAWLLRAVPNDYEPAYPALEEFLTSQGRLKFLHPLYSALVKTDEGRARAERIYAEARPLYHPMSVRAIDRLLGR